MRRMALFVAACIALAMAAPATADEPDSFTACGKDSRNGECTTSVSVAYGETVYLKGKVAPSHADLRAAVWHQDIYGDWSQVDTVAISDKGRMKYAWHTTQADGGQENPHHWQFRIKDHGKSNKVKVLVWLGE